MSEDLKAHLVSKIRQTLRGPFADPISDIYALSFFVYPEHPCGPTVDLSYNTLTHLRAAGGTPENKWNYAFWLQNSLRVIGDDGDPETQAKMADWLKPFGIDFDDVPLDDDEFDIWLAAKQRVFHEFWLVCAAVAKQLHQDGTIEASFGRSIPIIIHDLEYVPAAVDATVAGNPPEAVDEFVRVMREIGFA